MKRIGIFLLLLAMVFTGCSRIKNQVNNIKEEAKSKVSKEYILKPDTEKTDTTLLEQTSADTSTLGLLNYPLWDNPYSSGVQYPLYSPLKLDTFNRLGNFQSQYRWNNNLKSLWGLDSLAFSSNIQDISNLYERSN
jgi:hypothetical protein